MKSKPREASPMKAVAEELQALETAFHESLANYRQRVTEEIGLLRGAVEKIDSEPTPDQIRDLRDMLTLLRNFEIKSAKGRRKELKKVDLLVEDLSHLTRNW